MPHWSWTCLIIMALTVLAMILTHWSDRLAQGATSPYDFNISFSSSKAGSSSLSPIFYTFDQLEVLEDLSPANDEDWHRAALPKKGGFLWVEYNETSNEAWGVSMFHALHCLRMLRVAVQTSPYGPVEASTAPPNQPDGGTINHPNMDPTHLGHCIGYIAQVRSLVRYELQTLDADSVSLSILCVRLIVPLSHHGFVKTPLVMCRKPV